MPSSSPYQNNDYQAANSFRPYRLPINDIARASVAVDQFWKIPAQRIKSMYDNAAGLDLTIQANKDIRDQAVKESEKQINKLSSMDLSDPSVQKQATNLFKDLYNDRGVMSDHAATTHIAKVNNDAMSYRQSDNGKYYSPVNHKYALTGADDFKNAQDRMAGEAYLKQAKEYEQFYDPSSDLDKAMKHCKPSKATNDVIEGFYNNTYSDESLTAAKINTCLDAGLSDKAKRQLQINGAEVYRNNPEALRDKYIPHLQGTRSSLTQNRAAVQGILANVNNLKNLKPEQLAKIGISDISQITPDLIKSLRETEVNMDSRINNIDNTISKLNNGDFTPIQGDDFEPISAVVYSQDWMQNIAEGYSYNFTTNTKKADPVQSMFYVQNQLNARQEDDQQHDIQMQENKFAADLQMKLMESSSTSLKTMLKVGGENVLDNARLNNDDNSPFSTVESSNGYEVVTQKRVELQKQKSDLNRSVSMEAQQFGMPASISDINSPEGRAWFNAFETTAKGDPTKEDFIQRYQTKMATLNAVDALYATTQDNVDGNPELIKLQTDFNKKVLSTPDFKIGDITITGKDIANALSGKGSPLKIIKGSAGITATTSMGVPTSSGYKPDEYYYNGVKLPTTYGQEGNLFAQEINNITVANQKLINNTAKKRNELMKTETILQREGYAFPFLNDDKGALKLKIAQEIKLDKKYLNKLIIGQTDLDGQVVVTLTPGTKTETDYDQKALLDNLKRYNATDNQEVKSDPNSVMLKGITELDMINRDGNRLTEILPPYIRALEKRTSLNQSQSIGYIPSSDGRQYRMTITKNNDGGFIYKIIGKDAPTSPIASFTDRNRALQVFETRITKKGQVTINQ